MTTAPPAAAAPVEKKKHNLVEVFATVLLALAAVATAWSSYQANRWNGESVKAGARTTALRLDAARAQGLSEAEQQVDVATFIQWVDAYATDNQELQDFYAARFRDEFKPAFNAWIAMKPLQTPGAPPTPFKMEEYRPASKADAARLDAEAAASAQRVQDNLQRSANYVLAVVLFAVALFFAGISVKLTAPRLRIILLSLGWLVFLSAVVWIATFPVELSV
ncbi:MAG TPA: hypothetical protein VNC41_05065 [Acidimicrobiia bacterium]|nr:hypothetical protein [Acidimicrobiia bacterium]